MQTKSVDSDGYERFSSRTEQLEMVVRQWAITPTEENAIALKKAFHDPAFNPKTGLIDGAKTKYRNADFKAACVCGSHPNIARNTGPDENMFAAGCWYCGAPETVIAFPTEKEAIEWFEENVRLRF